MNQRQQRRSAAVGTTVVDLTPSARVTSSGSIAHGQTAQQPCTKHNEPLEGHRRQHECGRSARSERPQPVPLWKARNILLEAVISGRFLGTANDGPGSGDRGAAEAPEGVLYRRLEVCITVGLGSWRTR